MNKKQENALGKPLAERAKRCLSKKYWPRDMKNEEDKLIMEETADMLRVALDILDDPVDTWTARDLVYSGMSQEKAKEEEQENIKMALELANEMVEDLELYITTLETNCSYRDWQNYRENKLVDSLVGFEAYYYKYFDRISNGA